MKDLEKDLKMAMEGISNAATEESCVRDVMDALQGIIHVPGSRRDARVWLPQIETLARAESRCAKVVPVVYNDVGIRAMGMAAGILREHAASDGSRVVRALVVTLRKQLMHKVIAAPTGSLAASHIDIFRWARNRQGWVATLTVHATDLVSAMLRGGGGMFTATQLLPTIGHVIVRMAGTTIECETDIQDMSSEVAESLNAWIRMLAEANRIGARAAFIVVPHSMRLVAQLLDTELRTAAVRASVKLLVNVAEKLVVDHDYGGESYNGDDRDVVDAGRPFVGCWNTGCVNLAGGSEDRLPLMKCAGCHVAKYCSSQCQVQAWQHDHKNTCQPMLL
jgi:hypothetical protein